MNVFECYNEIDVLSLSARFCEFLRSSHDNKRKASRDELRAFVDLRTELEVDDSVFKNPLRTFFNIMAKEAEFTNEVHLLINDAEALEMFSKAFYEKAGLMFADWRIMMDARYGYAALLDTATEQEIQKMYCIIMNDLTAYSSTIFSGSYQTANSEVAKFMRNKLIEGLRMFSEFHREDWAVIGDAFGFTTVNMNYFE